MTLGGRRETLADLSVRHSLQGHHGSHPLPLVNGPKLFTPFIKNHYLCAARCVASTAKNCIFMMRVLFAAGRGRVEWSGAYGLCGRKLSMTRLNLFELPRYSGRPPSGSAD